MCIECLPDSNMLVLRDSFCIYLEILGLTVILPFDWLSFYIQCLFVECLRSGHRAEYTQTNHTAPRPYAQRTFPALTLAHKSRIIIGCDAVSIKLRFSLVFGFRPLFPAADISTNIAPKCVGSAQTWTIKV